MSARWIRRMATVAMAGGLLLTGGAAAQATEAPVDPAPGGGLLSDLLDPTGGLDLDDGPAADPAEVVPSGGPAMPAVPDVPGPEDAQERPDETPANPTTQSSGPVPRATSSAPSLPASTQGATVLGRVPRSGGPDLPLGNIAGLGDLAPADLLGGGLQPDGAISAPADVLPGARTLPAPLAPDDAPANGLPAGGTSVPVTGTGDRPPPADDNDNDDAADDDGTGSGRDFTDGRPVAGEDTDFD